MGFVRDKYSKEGFPDQKKSKRNMGPSQSLVAILSVKYPLLCLEVLQI